MTSSGGIGEWGWRVSDSIERVPVKFADRCQPVPGRTGRGRYGRTREPGPSGPSGGCTGLPDGAYSAQPVPHTGLTTTDAAPAALRTRSPGSPHGRSPAAPSPHAAEPRPATLRPCPCRAAHQTVACACARRRPGERRHESCSVLPTAPSGRPSGAHAPRTHSLADPRQRGPLGRPALVADRLAGGRVGPDHGPDPDPGHAAGDVRARLLAARGDALLRPPQLHPDGRLGPDRRHVQGTRQRPVQHVRRPVLVSGAVQHDGPQAVRAACSRRGTSAATSTGRRRSSGCAPRATPRSRTGVRTSAAGRPRTRGLRSLRRISSSSRRSRRTAATGGTSRTRRSAGPVWRLEVRQPGPARGRLLPLTRRLTRVRRPGDIPNRDDGPVATIATGPIVPPATGLTAGTARFASANGSRP